MYISKEDYYLVQELVEDYWWVVHGEYVQKMALGKESELPETIGQMIWDVKIPAPQTPLVFSEKEKLEKLKMNWLSIHFVISYNKF